MTREEIQLEIDRLEELVKDQYDSGLHGSMVMKYIKCGKESCKCQDGYKHGPYPHIQYYDDSGKLRTLYIRKSLAEEYAERLDKNNEYRKNIKEIVRLYEKLKNKD